MAITQTDVDNLEAAMMRGELKVRLSNGQEVTYKSNAEMLVALDYAKRQLGGADFDFRLISVGSE
jgi:hypothetical protein